MRKAREFLDQAAELQQLHQDVVSDAAVSLFILTGIAAADMVCCIRTGYHPQGDNHTEAEQALRRCDPGSEKHLAKLLRLKTSSAYSPTTTTREAAKVAQRAAEALVARAAELT